MGMMFNQSEEIQQKVEAIFGNTDNFLITFKHNDAKSSLIKLLISNVFYTWDSSRSFILYFDTKGIHEKEISHTQAGNFLLMPWHEINAFNVRQKSHNAVIEFTHLDKKLAYEVPFEGKLCQDNAENFTRLQSSQWHQEE
ncbi:histidine kinase [Tuanshanicoccus lijuaniae]|uniref:histidine kinase n=1 Tax=Aerococcaceae bacterium zg-1292 TaxID=2774330 RepID=UPI001BD8DFDF|nr:histidine kinase [Aerococcaceae bacterium zg-BR9]MBS4457060.1 histidine kinase [Aerococcaceae bacterium zg-A91]MBS4458909.1 histidine kinase [Aerococcaceae bacterium zg-BR33]